MDPLELRFQVFVKHFDVSDGNQILLSRTPGQMADVPIYHIKVHLATRFSWYPLVPTCYRGQEVAYFNTYPELSSLGLGCPFLYNSPILVTHPFRAFALLDVAPGCPLPPLPCTTPPALSGGPAQPGSCPL